MKLLTISTIGVCALIAAGTRIIPVNPIEVASNSFSGLPATITTTDGDTYDGVTLIRTEPDGYLVNYQPGDNSVGVAKIKFARLSPEMQRQAGYNPAKAAAFESSAANAEADFAQARLAWQQADQADLQAKQARVDQEAQASAERAAAVAEMAQAQASAAQADDAVGNSSGSSTWTAGRFSSFTVPANSHGPVDGLQPASASTLGNLTIYRGPHK